MTAVVGQHAHVVQPIRFVNGKPVVFGEGNLVSNQSGASQDGMIALLDLAVTPRAARAGACGTSPPTSTGPITSSCPPRARSRRRTIGVAGRGARVQPISGFG